MKICGILFCRNESKKARMIMSYHMNYAGFDGFVYVDNDSTDNGFQYISNLKDKRIFSYPTQGGGLNQAGIGNHMVAWAFKNGYDIVIPVDCDMLWTIDKKPLEEEYQKVAYFIAPNYGMLAEQEVIDNTEPEEYRNNFWKYIKYQLVQPICTKAIITRYGFNTYGCEFTDGNHFVTTPSAPAAQIPGIYIQEYGVINYEDLVRKTVNTAIGRILFHGYPWTQGKIGAAHHTWVDINKLSIDGHVHEKWSTICLQPSDVIKMSKDGKDIILKQDLVDIQFSIIGNSDE